MGQAQKVSDVQILNQAIQDLPALPAVVIRVLETIDDENMTTKELERLIGADPALTAKLLRLVNSPHFGVGGRVESLSQAMLILGMRHIRNAVVTVSALSLFKAHSPRLREQLLTEWQHAFGSAAGAKLLAASVRLPSRDVELSFLGGLLHDIGRLFLLSSFERVYLGLIEVADRTGRSIIPLEIEAFGNSHAEIGAFLTRAWRFPESISETIESHEGPFAAEMPGTVYCVHAGSRICREALTGATEREDQVIDPFVFTWLGLDAETVARMSGEVMEASTTGSELFGMS